jgi:nitrile hydratase beta subunit
LNGVHDIGGMDGFGAIHRETDEPVFHEPWERRVFGMFITGTGLPPKPVDALRHQAERLDPVQYLGSTYYERWLAGMEAALIEAGTLNRNEIQAKVEQFMAAPDSQVPRREDPAVADRIARAFRAGNPVTRKIRSKARFAIGDRIVTRNLNPYGHTRLPRYARGKHGVIVAHHGAHVFPDTNAHGLGENPQHLYTVHIAAGELWGDSAEPNESVLIDLWESYLEKDKAAKARARSARTARKRVKAKASVSGKLRQSAASSKRSSAVSGAVNLKSALGSAKSKLGRTTASGGRRSTRSGRGSGKSMRSSR